MFYWRIAYEYLVLKLALVPLSLLMTNEYQSNVISRSSFRLMSENKCSQNYIPQKSHINGKKIDFFFKSLFLFVGMNSGTERSLIFV